MCNSKNAKRNRPSSIRLPDEKYCLLNFICKPVGISRIAMFMDIFSLGNCNLNFHRKYKVKKCCPQSQVKNKSRPPPFTSFYLIWNVFWLVCLRQILQTELGQGPPN